VIGAADARFGAEHVFVGRAELFAQAQIGQQVVDQSGNPGDVVGGAIARISLNGSQKIVKGARRFIRHCMTPSSSFRANSAKLTPECLAT